MSGFLSGRARRLTASRYVATLATCLAVTGLVVLMAPMIGVGLAGTDRHFEWLGVGAFASDHPLHGILWIRIPRVLASALVGGALAGAGCALQALLRNPLAEPFTLGISSGSSLAAVDRKSVV